jgi:hypothetical protein
MGLAQVKPRSFRQNHQHIAGPLDNFASAGNITFFGCTVVSTITLLVSLGAIAQVLIAIERLSCKSAVTRPALPSRGIRVVSWAVTLRLIAQPQRITLQTVRDSQNHFARKQHLSQHFPAKSKSSNAGKPHQ